MVATSEVVTRQVMEVVPLVMRGIRAQMRRHRTPGLSLPQFRVLTFLDRHAGASLSDVAEHIGVTLPSMSKMVDGLVEQKLVTRKFDAADRRRATLALTRRGRTVLSTARAHTQTYLAQQFESLPASKRAVIVRAMEILRPIFQSEREVALTRAE